MFENQFKSQQQSKLARYTAFSIVAHAAVVGAVLLYAGASQKAAEKELQVTFFKALPPPPPPPPPPPLMRHKPTQTVKPKPAEPTKIVQPKELPKETPKEQPQEEEPPPQEEEAEADEPEGVEGGVEGGVVAGVVGGVVGGMVGGEPSAAKPPEPPKARNVPPFVIQRDLIRQAPPRLSEVFKQAHRGRDAVTGIYKVCVGTDGHVYEVTPVKAIAGADEDIVNGIREEWLYKPQQVPACFLYNMVVTVQ